MTAMTARPIDRLALSLALALGGVLSGHAEAGVTAYTTRSAFDSALAALPVGLDLATQERLRMHLRPVAAAVAPWAEGRRGEENADHAPRDNHLTQRHV